MLNEVTLIGNLGKDPEIRRTQDGRPIANLSIATSERWKDKSTGEKREKTEWHKCVCFSEGLCGVIEQYLRKGSTVLIRGSLQTRKWTDQSGVEKYTTEVVIKSFDHKMLMLGGKTRSADAGGGDDDFGTGEHSAPRRATGTGSRSSMRNSDMDDDIPFSPEFR